MTPPEIDEDDSVATEPSLSPLMHAFAVLALIALAIAVSWVIITIDTKDEQRKDAERRYEELRDLPTPTVTVETPGPVRTKVVTTPGPTKTVYIERSSDRASRSSIRDSRKKSNARIDLRHSRLWDRIAACESGQRWSLNVGTYDGGLQFLPSTWRSWGGTDFAPYAHLATREEQITIANRSGRTNPWLKPWPVCGKKAAAELGYAYP